MQSFVQETPWRESCEYCFIIGRLCTGHWELEQNCSKELTADVKLSDVKLRGVVSLFTWHFLMWCTSVAFKFRVIMAFLIPV